MNLPPIQVLEGDESAVFPGGTDQLARDISPIEAVVGGVNSFATAFAGRQRPTLGFDQLLERGQQIGLTKDLSGIGGRPLLRIVPIEVR